jgi:serine/threonine protein kinase
MSSKPFNGWVQGPRLGEGGQSQVFVARNPEREAERVRNRSDLNAAMLGNDRDRFANALWSYARPDQDAESGALKIFKMPTKSSGIPTPPPPWVALERLKKEITALGERLPGLPKMLDYDVDERWIVSEFFPEGSYEKHLLKYKGRVLPALRAFRSLVNTVVSLHAKGYIHRDIKPHNIFIRGEELVLGDFGIVFMPGDASRVTALNERVGPRDYLPPWVHLGRRDAEPKPAIDIYMLGKFLWTMIDGRDFLPRELFKHGSYDFDLTRTFQGDPQMYFINKLLDACVVEHEKDCTLTAGEMLGRIDQMIQVAARGAQMLQKDVPRPCQICGDGFYVPEMVFSSNVPPIRNGDPVNMTLWVGNHQTPFRVYPYVCSYCGHLEFFTKSPPQ